MNLTHKNKNKNTVVFHSRSNYDCHLIMEELAQEFEGQFECLGENTEKYIKFSVPIERIFTFSKTVTHEYLSV